jgi:hypothetical protein
MKTTWLLALAGATTIAVVAVGFVILPAKGARPGPGPGDAGAAGDTSLVHIPATWATGTGHDLPTLVASTDVTFTGTVVGRSGQRDIPVSEVLPGRSLPITQFDVRVEEVAAGRLSAGTVIVVEQPGGQVTKPDGSSVAYVLEGDVPIAVGQKYLFFASFKDNGALAAAPFARFPIKDGSVTAPEGWAILGAVSQLSGAAVRDAMSEVRSDAN